MTRNLFEIVYRTGTIDDCQWHFVPGPFDAVARDAKRAELEAEGHKTLYYFSGTVAVIGLPEGWDFETWRKNWVASRQWS